MTIKEALVAELEPLTVSEKKLEKALGDLDGSATYVESEHEEAVDLCYAGLLGKMVAIAEEKEDDASIKFSTEYGPIVAALYRKWKKANPFEIILPKPTVKQILFW